ncbi:hypothetical protein SAMN05421504_113165 [Amycolatopsis xylanica]|uniref:Uncharacterized protein n=1 Tax=Amycolatopsis xylanica TaxID=589385 RepID=A0A1H3SGX6_9PSEU|nr:lasso RiPP family leader peptide-containing protein [Amycolatopsis xylanica]SDZ36359.1 hypothetical protein SAMN05421504_113165 [Amycolatopsis xylanica]
MVKNGYEAPAVIELGAFDEETGVFYVRNGEEVLWFFDTWI